MFFDVFRSFWCVNIKNNFFKIKKYIILIYFKQKNILKNNCYHISKQSLNERIHGFISIF
jgi:hypothetical protein